MRIILNHGKFHTIFLTRQNTDSASPSGFLGSETTPLVGDTIQHPSDSEGYVSYWRNQVNNALPKGLRVGLFGQGWDSDIYPIQPYASY